MPLDHLIDTFNQRFSEEQQLTRPPLHFTGHVVEGRFEDLHFTSHLQPVRFGADSGRVAGYDATLRVLNVATAPAIPGVPFTDGVVRIVDLDRLIRTVHMLNYLPLAHQDGYLFLGVHPRHVLAVKQDHGAYFEEIILRCGLQPRRVVITLSVGTRFDGQLPLLLERLRNYRTRGYATALRFEPNANGGRIERNGREFLQRFTPDFVRFDVRSLRLSEAAGEAERDRSALLNTLRRLDTQFVLENIVTANDAKVAAELRPDFVQGEFFEGRQNQGGLSLAGVG